MPPLHSNLSQQQNQQPKAASPFPETMEWEGETLTLVYNPYDQVRSQMRPDYSRLVFDHGDCYPVAFVNANNEQIQKWVVFVRLTCPAEPGTLVPKQHFYAFRLYDAPVSGPNAVDWRTLIFYGIKPREQSAQNEGQRFMNALLDLDAIKPGPSPQDDKWAEDFAGLQQQLARPSTVQPESKEEGQ